MILLVNGQRHHVDSCEPWDSLLTILRDRLGLYGSKNACEQGECGSCSVTIDGVLACACLVMGVQAQGRDVRTVEGLVDDATARAVRRALVEQGGVQCGFCTPGFVVSATSLIKEKADGDLDDDALLEALSGNLCRCTGYAKIVSAVRAAAEAVRTEQARKGSASDPSQVQPDGRDVVE